MTKDWDKTALEDIIRDEVEESLSLDYKGADALGKTNGKKKEITKDVSAMANSAGGTIIYGIREYDNEPKKHLPEKIDPILRSELSKEWLEQVISNIRPRIDNLIIHPVTVDATKDHVVYVVEIPKGTTAHQARDLRYYKRYNFESVPMEDHEIRDVMGRSQYPRIQIELTLTPDTERDGLLDLEVFYRNVGSIYARYVNGFLQVPTALFAGYSPADGRTIKIGDVQCSEVLFENIHKDIVDVKAGLPPLKLPGGSATGIPAQYRYVTRYDPLLPGLGRTYVLSLGITKDKIEEYADNLIRWSVYADNAPMKEGESRLGDIKLTD